MKSLNMNKPLNNVKSYEHKTELSQRNLSVIAPFFALYAGKIIYLKSVMRLSLQFFYCLIKIKRPVKFMLIDFHNIEPKRKRRKDQADYITNQQFSE